LLYGVLGDKVDLDLLKQELDDDYLTKVRTEIKRNSANNHINLNPNVYLNNIKNTTEKKSSKTYIVLIIIIVKVIELFVMMIS
jgi:hypothetical protein